MDAGLLPVKRLAQAKQRLAEYFDAATRREIARALYEDALRLCGDAAFLAWWVVSDDAEVLEAASRHGHRIVRDPGTGLNDALAAGISRLRAEGAGSVTIVPSDIPLATGEDIADLLDTGATSDVVVVPSERDSGTNGLYMRPPVLLTPSFGADSFPSHVAAAEDLGLRCSVLALPRLALDIDTIEGVDAFLSRAEADGTRTKAVLEHVVRSA